MHHNTRTSVAGFLDPEGFAEQVLGWLDDFSPLVEALGVLRQLDGEDSAISALLDSAPLRKLRLSWELWDCLASGEGCDPGCLIEEHLGEEWYSWLRFMVWGVPLPTQPIPTLSVVK